MVAIPKGLKLCQENKYGVSKIQWKKWPDVCQRVFNKVYEDMEQNPALFVHPETKKIAKRQWGTVSWNSAWIAADACQMALKDISKCKGYYSPELGRTVSPKEAAVG